jgi:hypothetical protein
MKKFPRKSVLLFAAAMALCAFAVPAMASAASWAPVGSEHTLDSANFGFTTSTFTTKCGESTFTTDVTSAAVMTITAVTFRRCTAVGPLLGSCTATWVPTALPWSATAVSLTNIEIHNINIHVRFENLPGSIFCNVTSASTSITGTLTSGTFNNVTHTMHFSDADRLTSLSPQLGDDRAFGTGTLRDTQQTLVANP